MSQLPEHYRDVGPGWLAILSALHEKLMEQAPAYEVAQVKEKFGGLRVYLHYDVDSLNGSRIDELVNAAETMADATCERCGGPGTLRQGGWLLTLCDNCQKEHELAKARRWGSK
jgi:hypothetical protein